MLKEAYDVKIVMILSVCNRDKCREVSPQTFQDRAYLLNGKLTQTCKNRPGIHFVNLRGFARDTAGNTQNVRTWASDGIRPGPDRRSRDSTSTKEPFVAAC